jgi:hypothetical protein
MIEIEIRDGLDRFVKRNMIDDECVLDSTATESFDAVCFPGLGEDIEQVETKAPCVNLIATSMASSRC